MILLDAVFINNSGGKVLLDYLVPQLLKKYPSASFLLDDRVKESFHFLPTEQVTFIPNSLIARHKFYQKNQSKFSSILCFGNVPPSVRVTGSVITYFHNSVLFYTGKDFPMKVALGYKVKSIIIRLLKKNTDRWCVQTPFMKSEMEKHWIIKPDSISVVPFFRSTSNSVEEVRSPLNYYFISDGHPNKMHSNLLEAFRKANQLYPNLTLNLTISGQYPELINKIEAMQKEGLGVKNLGWCSADSLISVYSKGGYLIFPSTQESFGLGLIEAAQHGMKVIASELPFVHEVIEPSLTFDPWSVDSIAAAIKTSVTETLPPTRLKVENKISSLLDLLKS